MNAEKTEWLVAWTNKAGDTKLATFDNEFNAREMVAEKQETAVAVSLRCRHTEIREWKVK